MYWLSKLNVGLKFFNIFEKPTWHTAAILEIESEKLVQNFLILQNDTLHKFGYKTANIQ